MCCLFGVSRSGFCFWSLKNEWTKFESYENLDDAKKSAFKYIQTF